MAYITVGSTFTPLTYEERIKPYQEYIAKAEKLEDQYNKELLSLTQLNSLLPEGSQLKAQSQQLIDRLNTSIDLLQNQGWDRETKKELNDLRRSTQAFITPATSAMTKYEKYIDERMALENQYGRSNVLFRDSYTIDDFAYNKSGEEISHHPSYINMSLLDKDVMTKVIASSSTTSPVQLRSRTQGDNVIGTYYKGYSYDDAVNLTGNLATIYEDSMAKIQEDYALTEAELAIMDERIREAIISGASHTYKEYDQVEGLTERAQEQRRLEEHATLVRNYQTDENGELIRDNNGNYIPRTRNNSDPTTYLEPVAFTLNGTDLNSIPSSSDASLTLLQDLPSRDQDDVRELINNRGLNINNYNLKLRDRREDGGTLEIYLYPKSRTANRQGATTIDSANSY